MTLFPQFPKFTIFTYCILCLEITLPLTATKNVMPLPERMFMLDLGREEVVTDIVIYPSNDDNYIVPKNAYELFYCDNGKWISLGAKKPLDTVWRITMCLPMHYCCYTTRLKGRKNASLPMKMVSKCGGKM